MKEAIIQYNDNPDADGGHMVISWEPLVRCKDCKYWTVGDIGTYCPYHHDARPDWFCADGGNKDE